MRTKDRNRGVDMEKKKKDGAWIVDVSWAPRRKSWGLKLERGEKKRLSVRGMGVGVRLQTAVRERE